MLSPALPRSARAPLLLAVGVLLGIRLLIAPLFGPIAPYWSSIDFINHTALIAGALDTLRTVGGVPISSDRLVPGTEYPYFLFGNAGFYVPAALISYLVGLPPYLGMGAWLATAFAVGAWGMYSLARGIGAHPYLAVALGLLYAAGPVPSTNLFVRAALAEYAAWQVMPLLLLLVRRPLELHAGAGAMLAGALALAAPFYLHKLVAPHMALVLATLALNGVPFTRRVVIRLAVLGLVAICLTVPAGYPLVRGLAAEDVAAISGNQRPEVVTPSWVNLFWPWAKNSLAEDPGGDGGLPVQVGLVSTLGVVLGLAALVAWPRTALARGLPVLIAVFGIYVLLVGNGLNVWDILPAPLAYVQFSHRLLGVTHLVGFLLLAAALAPAHAPPTGIGPPRLRLATTGVLVALATLSTSTYWRLPRSTDIVSAAIRPSDLIDISHFYARAGRSTLLTGHAIAGDGRLTVPPMPISVPDGVSRLVLAGTADPTLFEHSKQPLTIRLYGFIRRGADAGLDDLTALFRARRGRPYPVEPIHDLVEREARESRRARASLSAGRAVPLPDVEWAAVRLAQANVASTERFELQAELDESVDAVALECSRATGLPTEYVGWRSERATCVTLEYLAVPNEGPMFVEPRAVPAERVTRGAHGRLYVDARGLPAGHYLLPTFDYRFLRVHAADGTLVPTGQFAARTAIRHLGETDAYAVSYALEAPVLAALGGLVLLALYFGAERRCGRYTRSRRAGAA